MNAYVCGCVRNNAPYLPRVFFNISQLSPLIFNKIHIVIAYDDSDDGSLEFLFKMQTHFPQMDILRGESEYRTHVRVENIARARNAILAHLRQIHHALSMEEAVKWPYFIMMDMDEVNGVFFQPNNLAAVLKPDVAIKWDAVSFNRRDYYDIWALSFDPYNYSCWHWEDPVPVCEKMKNTIETLLRETPQDEFVSCNSAFNGFAVYRIDVFLDGQYLPQLSPYMFDFPIDKLRAIAAGERRFHTDPDYRTATDPEIVLGDCEHRHFHMEAVMWKGARIRISPRQLFYS